MLTTTLQNLEGTNIGFSMRGFDMYDDNIHEIVTILKSANGRFKHIRFPHNNMKVMRGDLLSMTKMLDLSYNAIDTIEISDEVSLNSLSSLDITDWNVIILLHSPNYSEGTQL